MLPGAVDDELVGSHGAGHSTTERVFVQRWLRRLPGGRMPVVQEPGPSSLELGRTAYAERRWRAAYESLAQAPELEAEDLELLAMAKLMLGRDDELVHLERAHHRYLERGETQRAVRAATWIGMNLGFRGAIAPATAGWAARSGCSTSSPGTRSSRGT